MEIKQAKERPMNHNLARLVAEVRGWTVKHWAVGSGASGSDHYQLVDETGRGLGKPHIGEAHVWADAPDPLTWAVAGELLEEMAHHAAERPHLKRSLSLQFDADEALAWECGISRYDGEEYEALIRGWGDTPRLAIALAWLRWRGVGEEQIGEAMDG